MNHPFYAAAMKRATAAAAMLLLAACVQMPTEKQSVSDLRPGISFKTTQDAQRSARVQVDGLDVGAVGDYLEGQALVRVPSGMHLVRVDGAGQTLLEEKVYLGDGVNRSFILK